MSIRVGMNEIRELILKSMRQEDYSQYCLFKRFLEKCEEIQRKRGYMPAGCPKLLPYLDESLYPWVLDRDVEIIIKDGFRKEVIKAEDDVYEGNRPLLPEALCVISRGLCICGGGECAETPVRTCYEGDFRILDGRVFCSTDRYYTYWYNKVFVSDGLPFVSEWDYKWVGLQDYDENAERTYDPDEKALMYHYRFIFDSDQEIECVGLGTNPTDYYSGTCCASCPPDAVQGYNYPYVFPVIYIPTTYTFRAGVEYIVAVLLYLG